MILAMRNTSETQQEVIKLSNIQKKKTLLSLFFKTIIKKQAQKIQGTYD